MNKDLILKPGTKRLLHIGNRVKLFRECKDMDIKTLAERCGFTLDEACEIETGRCRKLNTVMVLQISEVLGIAFSDLFETDEGKYFSNFFDPDVVEYAFKKAKSRKFTHKFIAEALNCTETSVSNFKYRRIVPHPFVLGNLFGLLGITATELKNELAGEPEKPVEEPVNEEPVSAEPAKQEVMDEVIKALEIYKNIKTCIEELDRIIAQAQNLKALLAGGGSDE